MLYASILRKLKLTLTLSLIPARILNITEEDLVARSIEFSFNEVYIGT